MEHCWVNISLFFRFRFRDAYEKYSIEKIQFENPISDYFSVSKPLSLFRFGLVTPTRNIRLSIGFSKVWFLLQSKKLSLQTHFRFQNRYLYLGSDLGTVFWKHMVSKTQICGYIEPINHLSWGWPTKWTIFHYCIESIETVA